jgi:hypothetical protein
MATFIGDKIVITGQLLGHWILDCKFVIISKSSLNGGHEITGAPELEAITPERALDFPATVIYILHLSLFVSKIFKTPFVFL